MLLESRGFVDKMKSSFITAPMIPVINSLFVGSVEEADAPSKASPDVFLWYRVATGGYPALDSYYSIIL